MSLLLTPLPDDGSRRALYEFMNWILLISRELKVVVGFVFSFFRAPVSAAKGFPVVLRLAGVLDPEALLRWIFF